MSASRVPRWVERQRRRRISGSSCIVRQCEGRSDEAIRKCPALALTRRFVTHPAMRPAILNPLFAEVETLKGVGPGIAKALKRLDITRVVDLAYHPPTGTIDRVRASAASASLLGRNVVIDVTPFQARQGGGRGPLRIFAADSAGNTISLIFFNNPSWAKKQLPLDEARTVSGKLEAYGDEWQIIHPEVLDASRAAEVPLRECVYPLTEGIANRRMRELALGALERSPELAEWIEPGLLDREHWPSWHASLAGAHSDPESITPRKR